MRAVIPMLCVACAPPPIDAPAEVTELSRFLFEHFEDEDDRTLAAGLANLELLLREEDYSIPPSDRSLDMGILPADRLGTLSLPEGVSAEDQLSVAISGLSRFPLEAQVAIMTDSNQTCLESEITQWARRTFPSDPACFKAGDCDQLQTLTVVRRKFSVFLDIWYDQHKTYRRVSVGRADGDDIDVILGRAWIEQTFEGEGGTTMDQLFHLDAYIEDGTGNTFRWFTMWSSLTGLLVDDATYSNLVVDGLEEALQFGEEYLGEEESSCRHDRDAPKPERPR